MATGACTARGASGRRWPCTSREPTGRASWRLAPNGKTKRRTCRWTRTPGGPSLTRSAPQQAVAAAASRLPVSEPLPPSPHHTPLLPLNASHLADVPPNHCRVFSSFSILRCTVSVAGSGDGNPRAVAAAPAAARHQLPRRNERGGDRREYGPGPCRGGDQHGKRRGERR